MENFLTKNGNLFGAEFRVSTRRLPAAARSRAVAHRGRADRQEQRRNHPKEPPKTLEGANLIKLSFDRFAIVDAEDYDRLSKYRWCTVKASRTFYAKTFHLSGAMLSMHRIVVNAPKGLFVDHINHNGLDNRKANLRICTHIQNLRNKRPKSGCTSKYKGVHWCKGRNKFRANIYLNKKAIHLGYFHDEIAAAKAYDKAAKKFFGEFAYLNFP